MASVRNEGMVQCRTRVDAATADAEGGKKTRQVMLWAGAQIRF
jgi:hypothetical protein